MLHISILIFKLCYGSAINKRPHHITVEQVSHALALNLLGYSLSLVEVLLPSLQRISLFPCFTLILRSEAFFSAKYISVASN